MEKGDAGIGPLVVVLGFFLLVGAPLAAYVWHTLSEVLSGRVHPGPVVLAAVLLALFLVVLRVLTGYLRRTGA